MAEKKEAALLKEIFEIMEQSIILKKERHDFSSLLTKQFNILSEDDLNILKILLENLRDDLTKIAV